MSGDIGPKNVAARKSKTSRPAVVNLDLIDFCLLYVLLGGSVIRKLSAEYP